MTSYSSIKDMFMHRVEEDRRYFNYAGLTDDQAFELAQARADAYLEEAIAVMLFKGNPQVDFTDRDDTQFNFDLTAREKYLLSSLMYLQHLDRSIAYLKTLSVNYTSTDLRVFDPSNARKTFLNMYLTVKANCDELLDIYRSTNRDAGNYIGIDYAALDPES